MHAYIHTFIPTRTETILAPLWPTEVLQVRLFLSPHRVGREEYTQYLGWLGCADQLTEWHDFGQVPDTVTKASLLPPNIHSTQVGPIVYDFMLESLDDYTAYLEFVRQTLAIEAARPVFRPQARTTDAEDPLVMPLFQQVDDRMVESREDLEDKPTFVLEHPAHPTESHRAYGLWSWARNQFENRVQFYRRVTNCSEPSLLFPVSKHCWMVCKTTEAILDSMASHQHILHELSTGHVVTERQGRSMWDRGTALGKLVGTEVMPHVKIVTTLVLQDHVLQKRGLDMLEMRLAPGQLAMIRPFFECRERFSLAALYALFATPHTSRPAKLPTFIPSSPVNPPTLTPTPTFATGSTPENPAARDTFSCDWEPVKTVTPVTPAAAKIREELLALQHEFRTSQPLDATAVEDVTAAAFQFGFLLYLLKRQADNRLEDYRHHIDMYKQGLRPDEFTAAHQPILTHLLASNTEFLAPVATLEQRILLTIYQYPVELKVGQTDLFVLVVKEFATRGLKRGEGRVGAKAVWDAFLGFLRGHRLDYVGFFGSQQEFNDVLRDLGWEQKRMAAGKVWLKMELAT